MSSATLRPLRRGRGLCPGGFWPGFRHVQAQKLVLRSLWEYGSSLRRLWSVTASEPKRIPPARGDPDRTAAQPHSCGTALSRQPDQPTPPIVDHQQTPKGAP